VAKGSSNAPSSPREAVRYEAVLKHDLEVLHTRRQRPL
jgi:hypothetical protein